MIVTYYILNSFDFTAAGFGLRVVGGKTGTDGRTFAYVMWTLPDGPAAKVGIQRGDKVRTRQFFFFFFFFSPRLGKTPFLKLFASYSARCFFYSTRTYIKERRAQSLEIEIGVPIVSIGRLDLGNKNVLATCAHRNAGNILQAVNACEYRQPFSPAVILIKLSTAAPNANASRSLIEKTYTILAKSRAKSR